MDLSGRSPDYCQGFSAAQEEHAKALQAEYRRGWRAMAKAVLKSAPECFECYHNTCGCLDRWEASIVTLKARRKERIKP